MSPQTGVKIAYLQLHRICDQECIFCAQPTNGKYLNFGEIKSQIDFFISKGYTGIIFSGGEPSISPYFFDALKYCHENNIDMTILSNGHNFQDFEFTQKAIRAGLKKFHISLHSHIEKIHDTLVKKQGSYKRSLKAMKNIIHLGGELHINITINSYNVSYFPKSIEFLLHFFPEVSGFVMNNLEISQIPQKHISVVPSLADIQKILFPSIEKIVAAGKLLRIERIPLCYLRGYEHLSVDVEYSIMKDSKFLHYLDSRDSGELNKTTYSATYMYGKNCTKCDLKKICAGIYGLGKIYDEMDLIPQSLHSGELRNIIQKSFHYLR